MVTPDQDEPDASKNEPFIPWEVDAEIRDLIRQVARQLLGGFPLVRRWNETDDVCQEAEIRLQRALSNVQAESRRHLENLTALQIRRTLIDLSRKYQRTVDQCASRWTPNSSDASHCRLQIEFTDSGSPENLEQWTRLHIQVDEMSESDREVFQLRVYRSMQRQEIADLLNVDITTVQRRWRSAREFLNARFPGDS